MIHDKDITASQETFCDGHLLSAHTSNYRALRFQWLVDFGFLLPVIQEALGYLRMNLFIVDAFILFAIVWFLAEIIHKSNMTTRKRDERDEHQGDDANDISHVTVDNTAESSIDFGCDTVGNNGMKTEEVCGEIKGSSVESCQLH